MNIPGGISCNCEFTDDTQVIKLSRTKKAEKWFTMDTDERVQQRLVDLQAQASCTTWLETATAKQRKKKRENNTEIPVSEI